MNAAEIVSILLEDDITPEEFLKGAKHILSWYEFGIGVAAGESEVKRWYGGSYDYLGSVMFIKGKGWYPYKIAPGYGQGRHHSYVAKVARYYATREEAARALGRYYDYNGYGYEG